MPPDPFEVLRRLSQWDQFNPPMTGDHAYWKREIDALLALESRVILCEREPMAWAAHADLDDVAVYDCAKVELRSEQEHRYSQSLHRPFRTDEEKSNG